MTNRLTTRSLWTGLFLMGLLLATPLMAAETNGSTPDKQTGPLIREEHALQKLLQLMEAEDRGHRQAHHPEGTFGAGVEKANEPSQTSSGNPQAAPGSGDEDKEQEAAKIQALKQLLQRLEAERHHHHHHQEDGAFGSGFQQPDTSPASTGSQNGTDSGDDSSGGSGSGNSGSGGSGSGGSGSGGSGSGGAMGGTSGNTSGTTGKSPSSSSPSSSSPSSASKNQQQHQHPGVNAFLRGLRHAEHERRERREARRARAFARGLAALKAVEEHAQSTSAPSTAGASTPTNSRNTPSTQPNSGAPTTPQTAQQHDRGHEPNHSAPAAPARRVAGFQHSDPGKSLTGSHGRTGALLGQHHGPAHSAGNHPAGGPQGAASAKKMPAGHH